MVHFISGEAERILKCKGRVFALEDEPEVARVWLPYDDAPGLAMARAFGDFCLKDFGLIAVPEVTHRKLDPKDEFIVLATDGVSSSNKCLRYSINISDSLLSAHLCVPHLMCCELCTHGILYKTRITRGCVLDHGSLMCYLDLELI